MSLALTYSSIFFAVVPCELLVLVPLVKEVADLTHGNSLSGFFKPVGDLTKSSGNSDAGASERSFDPLCCLPTNDDG